MPTLKSDTQKPFGTLDQLPITAGPWKYKSYCLIEGLPVSNRFDCLLTVIDQLSRMAHFGPCRVKMSAKKLEDLMLKDVCELHSASKINLLDWGRIFISQITKELNKHLWIWLHLSTMYHLSTNVGSELSKRAVKQGIHHFVQYCQENWELLLIIKRFYKNLWRTPRHETDSFHDKRTHEHT